MNFREYITNLEEGLNPINLSPATCPKCGNKQTLFTAGEGFDAFCDVCNYKWWSSTDPEDAREEAALQKILAQLNANTPISEATATRYSVEANFRSRIPEVLEAFAKIALGYVSAAMKQSGYHVKHVFDDKPLRILVSTRNWDDGEWIAICSFNPEHDGGSFIISKGFYNRDRRSVSIQNNKKANGNSAAEITVELRNLMHQIGNEKDRRQEKLNPVSLKRGPKS